MIKCTICNSNKIILKIEEAKYKIINECYNCYNIIHLFIDDYLENYQGYNSINTTQNANIFDKNLNLCQKHNKQYNSFCFICKTNLCNECLISHNIDLHLIKEIKDIINQKDKEEIILYKNEIFNLKEEINQKIEIIKQKNENGIDKIYNKLLNSILNLIKVKEYFLNINLNDVEVLNSYDIISLKYIVNKFNKLKLKKLLNNIKVKTYPEKENDIKNFNKCIYYSINSIPNNKIVHTRTAGWANHVILLKNGNILSSHWDYLSLFKINREKNSLELILRININNGSINHIYEYKKNKILVCDNQMKIIQLSQDNKSFKCLNIMDYGRKIIPFIPNSQTYKGNKKFLFMATPNGIKLYSYPDDNNENDSSNIDNFQIKNELKFLGAFSTDYDYSAIVQINNKICGIYKTRNSYNNNFIAWEINHDFNDESNFNLDKFNLLGEIKNVNSAIGRYSLSKLNDNFAIVGTMKYNYHSYSSNDKSGLTIISLNPVEIVQYIKTDEVTSIECLQNKIILTGGKDVKNNNYYIKQWKFDEDNKELFFIGEKKIHNDFINTILSINDGFFISCGRDGNIYIVYNYI